VVGAAADVSASQNAFFAHNGFDALDQVCRIAHSFILLARLLGWLRQSGWSLQVSIAPARGSNEYEQKLDREMEAYRREQKQKERERHSEKRHEVGHDDGEQLQEVGHDASERRREIGDDDDEGE
jgi:cell division protein FtsB